MTQDARSFEEELKNMDLRDLKAAYYDTQSLIQNLDVQAKMINQEISRKTVMQQQAAPQEKKNGKEVSEDIPNELIARP